MATVYVTEFAGYGTDFKGINTTVPQQLPLAEQTVAIGGSSVQSAAFNALTSVVRVHTDAICSVAFGVSATATATKMRMAAGQTEYFAVPQNGAFKVAVITNT